MSLTEEDRRLIAKAHEVAAMQSGGAMLERYDERDHDMARAAALGEAQFLLLELVAIIERLEGSGADAEAPEVIIAAWRKRCPARDVLRSLPVL